MSSFFKHNSCTGLNRDEPKILENTALLNQGARPWTFYRPGRYSRFFVYFKQFCSKSVQQKVLDFLFHGPPPLSHPNLLHQPPGKHLRQVLPPYAQLTGVTHFLQQLLHRYTSSSSRLVKVPTTVSVGGTVSRGRDFAGTIPAVRRFYSKLSLHPSPAFLRHFPAPPGGL